MENSICCFYVHIDITPGFLRIHQVVSGTIEAPKSLRDLMHDSSVDHSGETLELEFMRGHIAATMALIHGLIDQGAVDRDRLDTFFAGFVSQLPQTRATLGLRMVINQWREKLRSGEDETVLRNKIFEVIAGGRATE